MTHRRMPGRKKANLFHGPRNPGLATIIATPEHPKGTCKLRTDSTCSSSVNTIIPEIRDAPVTRRTEEGIGKQVYVEGRSKSGPLQRVCLGSSARLYAHCTVAEAWEARRAPLHCNNVVRERNGAPTSLPCSPVRRQQVLSEKETAQHTDRKFVCASLGGSHLNAELAATATDIEERLGSEDAQLWEELAPMYRVLVLALFTIAASAVKDRNKIENERLLEIVTVQKKEIILMRNQLRNQSCCQVTEDPNRRPFIHIVEGLQSVKNTQHTEFRDVGCLDLDDADKNTETEACKRSDVNSLKDTRLELPLPVEQDLWVGDSGDLLSEEDSEVANDDAVNKNVVLVEAPGKEFSCEEVSIFLREANSVLEKCREDQEKWYVNPMASATEDCYDLYHTPERENLVFSKYSPLETQQSHEWPPRPSVGHRRSCNADYRMLPLVEVPPASPLQVIPCHLSKESVALGLDTRCMDEEVTALRVECAAVVLKLKSKVMTALRKEAARCMAEQNVCSTEMKVLLATLLAAVAGCWRETVPQALAALGLSPSEYNSCLLNNTQRKMPNVSECARDTDGWRQFLEEHDTNDRETEQRSNRVAALCLCASNFEQLSICKSSKDDGRGESSEREVTSFFSCAPEESSSSSEHVEQSERIESDTSCSRAQSEQSPESVGKFVSCWENPPKRLKNTSAQVIHMELQMKRLQQDVLKFEAEREMKKQTNSRGIVVELESKATGVAGLPKLDVATCSGRKSYHEACEMGLAELRRELQLKNRVIAELKSEVESRGIIIADIERKRKELIQAEFAEMTLQLKSKDYKILELSSEVQLRGLEVADLERKMKVKLHTDVAEMTRHIQLIESKFMELTTKLQSKDVEIADLERNQKEFILAKDEELAALREECLRCHAHPDQVATVAQSTGNEKLSMISNLVHLCGVEDNEISKVKNLLRNVEMKIEDSNAASCSEDELSAAPVKVLADCLAAALVLEHHEPCNMSPPTPCDVRDQSDPKECDLGVQVETEELAAAEGFKSHDAWRSRSPPTLAQTMKPRKSNNGISKSKRTDFRRVSLSTTGKNLPNPNRLRASLTFTSAAISQRSGQRHSSKSTEQPEKKPVLKPTKLRRKLVVSPPRAGQPGVKVLSSVSNTLVKSTKGPTEQQHLGNSLVGEADGRPNENSAVKRRRWAA